MQAWGVVWRAAIGFYNELFLLMGMSGLWWLTGGVAAGAAGVFAWAMLAAGGPVWLAPLVAIPAGPASAALANAARQAARGRAVGWSHYWQGWRACWRQALAVSAASMGILTLLLLNWQFYLAQAAPAWQIVSFLWLWLALFWLGAQLYLYPLLAGLERPRAWTALRTAALLSFANPLFTLLLVVAAAILTAVSIFITILVVLAWPALMSLIGEQGLMVLLARAGRRGETPGADHGDKLRQR